MTTFATPTRTASVPSREQRAHRKYLQTMLLLAAVMPLPLALVGTGHTIEGLGLHGPPGLYAALLFALPLPAVTALWLDLAILDLNPHWDLLPLLLLVPLWLGLWPNPLNHDPEFGWLGQQTPADQHPEEGA
ncbi:hypothetical protein [Deinococcus sp. SL84]|uniref:hypothetical protein n=1 Tax=Deinococcus sp. SL84 TaxID=2994663 RepID=UPI002273EBD9|nr:hypothetical protein [Deinococcus sp. SL84]MCY1703964.1 hypothetical protein [Deinococcus sp. SL84]